MVWWWFGYGWCLSWSCLVSLSSAMVVGRIVRSEILNYTRGKKNPFNFLMPGPHISKKIHAIG